MAKESEGGSVLNLIRGKSDVRAAKLPEIPMKMKNMAARAAGRTNVKEQEGIGNRNLIVWMVLTNILLLQQIFIKRDVAFAERCLDKIQESTFM